MKKIDLTNVEDKLVTLITSYRSVPAIGNVKEIRFKVLDNDGKCIMFEKIQLSANIDKHVRLLNNFNLLFNVTGVANEFRVNLTTTMCFIDYFKKSIEALEKLG